MKTVFLQLRQVFAVHVPAIFCAAAVGVLSIAPLLAFIGALGEEYRGIPMLQTPNEAAYLSIMREVLDGHPFAASVPFFEYKDALPLLPPTFAIPYAFLSVLFGVSITSVLVASKFILPAALFLLVYACMFRLCDGGDGGSGRKLLAIAAALFVTLGFDLVDYRSIFDFFSGERSPDNFLIWTRPVNPISGALLLFTFLLSLWELHAGVQKRKAVLVGGLSLALMMMSYVFSWTLALAVISVQSFIALARREYKKLRSFFFVVCGGIILALPYWFLVVRAAQLPYYSDAAARIGLFFTREPHWNKFVLAALVLFAAMSVFHFMLERRQDRMSSAGAAPEGALPFLGAWWWFALSLLIGSFLVYLQQMITGREIWYYHYVFYTIPLSALAVFVISWHFIRPALPRLWITGTVALAVFSVILGVYTQWAAYTKSFAYHAANQSLASFADYLAENAPEGCVVFPNTLTPPWDTFISAFTHCNYYISGERLLIAPPERFVHNYLSFLRLRGVGTEEIGTYLAQHRDEAAAYLYFQLQYTLGVPDLRFEALYEELPRLYREFLEKDFRTELKRYRIDYILAVDSLDSTTRTELQLEKPLYATDSFVLYKF